MSIADYVANIKIDPKNALGNLKKVDNEANKTTSRISNAFNKIGAGLSAIRLPAFSAMTSGILVMNKFILGARDVEEAVNAVQVVFGKSADNILKFSESTSKQVGLTKREFLDLSKSIGNLLTKTGKPIEVVSDLTIDLTKRASDMASIMNTSVRDAMSAVEQGIRGETEAMRRYGIDMTDDSLQNFFDDEGIELTVSSISNSEKRWYRTQMIMKETNVMAGDFLRTSHMMANKTRIQTARMQDLADAFGKEFMPIMMKYLDIKDLFISSLEGSSKETVSFAGKVIAATTALSGLALVASTIPFTLKAIKFGLVTLATPFTALASLSLPIIAAIAAGAATLYFAWEPLKRFLGGFWDGFKNSFSGLQPAFDRLGAAIGKVMDWFKELFGISDDTTDEMVDGFDKVAKAGEWLGSVIGSVFAGIADWISLVIDTVKDMIEAIKTGISWLDEMGVFSDASAINQTNNGNPLARGLSSGQQIPTPINRKEYSESIVNNSANKVEININQQNNITGDNPRQIAKEVTNNLQKANIDSRAQIPR